MCDKIYKGGVENTVFINDDGMGLDADDMEGLKSAA